MKAIFLLFFVSIFMGSYALALAGVVLVGFTLYPVLNEYWNKKNYLNVFLLMILFYGGLGIFSSLLLAEIWKTLHCYVNQKSYLICTTGE